MAGADPKVVSAGIVSLDTSTSTTVTLTGSDPPNPHTTDGVTNVACAYT